VAADAASDTGAIGAAIHPTAMIPAIAAATGQAAGVWWQLTRDISLN